MPLVVGNSNNCTSAVSYERRQTKTLLKSVALPSSVKRRNSGTPPLFILQQCQSQAWRKEEGDVNDLCYHSVVKLKQLLLRHYPTCGSASPKLGERRRATLIIFAMTVSLNGN